MLRAFLGAFRDPARRPQALVWTSASLILVVAFTFASLAVTSTAWFCNEVCHEIHYDNKFQYFASSHSKVSCLACHIPAELDGVRFVLEKAEKLTDVYAVIVDDYHLPLNPGSHIALTMPTDQCTQCHNLDNREVTPSSGVRISHLAHENFDLNCAVCHNRVAHPEIFDLELPGNEKHEDFMTMTACFRCHTLTDESPSEYQAPGACGACHPPAFELKPDTHRETGFYTERGESAGHAALARAEASETAQARAEWDEFAPEFRAKEPKIISRLINIPHRELIDVPPAATVNECETCHVPAIFCDGCHGIEIPHPAGFATDHAEQGLADRSVCATCHNKSGDVANDSRVCDQCHHDQGDPTREWFPQHPLVVKSQGAGTCFACHQETYCSSCHIRGTPSTPY